MKDQKQIISDKEKIRKEPTCFTSPSSNIYKMNLRGKKTCSEIIQSSTSVEAWLLWLPYMTCPNTDLNVRERFNILYPKMTTLIVLEK